MKKPILCKVCKVAPFKENRRLVKYVLNRHTLHTLHTMNTFIYDGQVLGA